MGEFLMLNMVATGYIACWATWCVLSPKVDDGIVGKAFYAFVAFASLSVAMGPSFNYTDPNRSEVLLNCSVALLSLRHQCMRLFWPWLQRKFNLKEPGHAHQSIRR